MEIYFNHDIDERLEHAYEEIDEILHKYGVEWCSHEACDIWLEVIETEKPRLKLISNEVDICDSD